MGGKGEPSCGEYWRSLGPEGILVVNILQCIRVVDSCTNSQVRGDQGCCSWYALWLPQLVVSVLGSVCYGQPSMLWSSMLVHNAHTRLNMSFIAIQVVSGLYLHDRRPSSVGLSTEKP